MSDKTEKQKNLEIIWNTINHPMVDGHKRATYSISSIYDCLSAIKKVMKEEGFKFDGDM